VLIANAAVAWRSPSVLVNGTFAANEGTVLFGVFCK
jgi:hypothetical protein